MYNPKYSYEKYLKRIKWKTGKRETHISLILPGKIKAEPSYDRPELNLKTDAFTYGGETCSSLYVYENGNFSEYVYSD